MEEFVKWLNDNKISHCVIDDDVVEIVELGLVYLCDFSQRKSVFKDGDFCLPESVDILVEDGVFYAAFPFGDNFYYYDLRGEFEFNVLKYVGKRVDCKVDVPFVNLGVHTPYELLSASGGISTLVKKVKFLGHGSVGVCDYNTMASTLMLQKECEASGVNPIFGYSLAVRCGDCVVEMKVYALSQDGLQNLLKIQRAVMVDADDNVIDFEILMSLGDGLVLVIGKLYGAWLCENKGLIQRMRGCFNMVFFQVDFTEYKADRLDCEVLDSMKAYFDGLCDSLSFSFEIEPILLCDSYYLDKDEANSRIVLNKIASGAAHRQSSQQYFKDVDEHYEVMKPIFSESWDYDRLFRLMCESTIKVSKAAVARFETTRNFMPRYDMTEKEVELYGDRHTMFLRLLESGFKKLVPAGCEDEYRKMLNKEIYVLEATDNVDYLLIQWDMVNWARENDILVGCGRGSAGGSLVLYLLGITLIDPIKYDLLFERFLLPERAGLYPSQVTKMVENIDSVKFVEINMENGRLLRVDVDAQLLVCRGNENIVIYADELRAGDDVVFDHRDLLWSVGYEG